MSSRRDKGARPAEPGATRPRTGQAPQLALDLAPDRKKRADALLADLNPPQREAVLYNDGPLLVLAGAGSGKTRALIRKIAWLVEIERLAPWEILAVTFTNRAAAEMRERAHHLLGERAEALWLGTFHAIGVRLLRQHGPRLGLPRHFVIYDDDDQETLIGRCLQRLDLDAKAWPARSARAWIDRQKQLCLGPDHPDVPRDTLVDKTHARVYEVYQAELAKAGAVDFGDLIWLPWRLATEIPEVGQELRLRWRYVLVDEFQDTNRAQYMLLRALLTKDRRLCVVGDDDQSIYRWRGAEVENILAFPDDFSGARVVRFEQNYRSTGHILTVAGAIIAQNRERHGKTLWTENPAGERVRVFTAQSDGDEAEWVASRIRALRSGAAGDLDGRDRPLAEHAIFYRTHAQSRAFEDRLRAAGLPYRVYGGLRFYDRAEIKDVVAYLKLVVNPEDGVALERIINKPARGIGRGTVDKIAARADAHGLSLWAATCAEARDGAQKLVTFVALIIDLREAAATASALDATRLVLERTGYLEHLKKDGTIEAETRAENVRELVAAVAEMGERRPGLTLAGFLDEVALVSGHDEADDGGDAVIMMTAHMAKGLEFDVVFATGLEEGLMPHANSIEDPRQMEEERRLAYVALTRARRHLHISWAQSRRRFGQSKPALRSRFLDALPREAIVEEGIADRPRYTLGGWSQAGPAGAAPRRPEAWEDRADPVPSWEDESQERDLEEGAGGLQRGARVFHPSFGQGRVEGVEGQGERAKVAVRFADGVTRKLLARAVVLV